MYLSRAVAWLPPGTWRRADADASLPYPSLPTFVPYLWTAMDSHSACVEELHSDEIRAQWIVAHLQGA